MRPRVAWPVKAVRLVGVPWRGEYVQGICLRAYRGIPVIRYYRCHKPCIIRELIYITEINYMITLFYCGFWNVAITIYRY